MKMSDDTQGNHGAEHHYVENCTEDNCPVDDDCFVIIAVAAQDLRDHETGEVLHPTGSVLWRSHAIATVDPATRLNLDYPFCEDRRSDRDDVLQFRLYTQDEAKTMGLSDLDHARVAAHATARFLVDGGEAANAVGLDREIVDGAAHGLIEGAVGAQSEEFQKAMAAKPLPPHRHPDRAAEDEAARRIRAALFAQGRFSH